MKQKILNTPVEFYRLDSQKQAALRQLGSSSIGLESYLRLSLPFPIGRIRPEIIKEFPITPENGEGHSVHDKQIIADYAAANAEVVARTARASTDKICEESATIGLKQSQILFGLHHTLLKFDQSNIGGSYVNLALDFDNPSISSDWQSLEI